MNSSQIHDFEDNVPTPTYAYYSKINSGVIDKKAWKSNFQTNVETACAGVDKKLGSVAISTKNSLTAEQQEMWDLYKAKNPNTADNVVASIIAGNPPPISGSESNQIKYLACQVAKMHAREYDPDQFEQAGSFVGIKGVFQKFASMKPYLIIIFFMSVFLYLQGVFGSMDIGYNIATNLFRGESGGDMNYWLGLLVGITIPFVVILWMFSAEICKSLEVQDNYDITKNPYGDRNKLSSGEKSIDYWMVALFVLFIYGFVGVLYTIGSMDKKMNTVVLMIVMGILILISVFLYIFYSYRPFLATADEDRENKKNVAFELFVRRIDDVSDIQSNQFLGKNIKKIFIGSVAIIYALAMLFFKVNQKKIGEGTWWGSVLRGMTGAGAILVLPILWVLNTVFAFSYFYIFPILLIFVRGIRYLGQMVMYKTLNSGGSLRNSVSDKFLREFGDAEMREYSPTWSLMGVSFLKTWMNMCGFENRFSKEIVEPDMYQRNMSQNSYVSSFYLLKMLTQTEKNKTGMMYSIVLIALTLIIGSTILYGTENVDKKVSSKISSEMS
jgi:hypothetical protein